jgi:septum formation protein
MILDALRTSFSSSTKVVLASASPRRAELLRQLGITKFDVRPSLFAEDLPKTADGASYARATAAAKAREVAAAVAKEREQEEAEAENGGGETSSKSVLIIAADTVVEVDSLILEKPSETDGGLQGKEMLRRLSGREHRVSTGVALVLLPRRRRGRGGGENENETEKEKEKSSSFSETTLVRFAELPESEIDAYVASGENLGKAGGYGIQVRRRRRRRGGKEFFFSSFLEEALTSLSSLLTLQPPPPPPPPKKTNPPGPRRRVRGGDRGVLLQRGRPAAALPGQGGGGDDERGRRRLKCKKKKKSARKLFLFSFLALSRSVSLPFRIPNLPPLKGIQRNPSFLIYCYKLWLRPRYPLRKS